jgi:hypothetical protein
MNPTYVTFEQAKILREKGFKWLCNYFYSQNGNLYPRTLTSGDESTPYDPTDFYENFNTIVFYNVDNKYQTVFSAPEQWQVVEWLRVNHGIWILVDWCEGKWCYEIQDIKRAESLSRKMACHIKTELNFDSPQEAYSAAFDYVLNNMI